MLHMWHSMGQNWPKIIPYYVIFAHSMVSRSHTMGNLMCHNMDEEPAVWEVEPILWPTSSILWVILSIVWAKMAHSMRYWPILCDFITHTMGLFAHTMFLLSHTMSFLSHTMVQLYLSSALLQSPDLSQSEAVQHTTRTCASNLPVRSTTSCTPETSARAHSLAL